MAYREDSELQLLEVSREARKLTQLVDSWSKAPNPRMRSRDNAKDLLRSALDLQESLVMLGNLQEATKTMSQIKNRLKTDTAGERGLVMIEDFGKELVASKIYGNKANNNSLYRRSRSSISSDGAASSRLSFRSSADSRYVESFYREKGGAESSQKVKAPSLIAKLMGLEEVPAAAAQPIKKDQKSERSLDRPKSLLDIEMPRAVRQQFVEQNSCPKRIILQNIIGIGQHKGQTNSDHDKGDAIQSNFSGALQSELCYKSFCFDDVIKPLAITKNKRLPNYERGEAHKVPLPDKSCCVPEVVQSVKLEEQEIVSDKGGQLARKFIDREVKSSKKTRVESAQLIKTQASVCYKEQRRMTVKSPKKTDEGQKPRLNGRKPRHANVVKPIAAVPLSQTKTTMGALAKADKRPVTQKNGVSSQAREPRNHSPAPAMKHISQNSAGPANGKKTAEGKLLGKSITIKTTTVKHKDGKEISACKKGNTSAGSIFPSDKCSKQGEQYRKTSKRDTLRKDQRAFCEIMPKTSKDGRSSITAEAATILNIKTNSTKAAGVEDDLKLFLLGSRSFLINAQELLGLDAHRQLCDSREGLHEVGTRDVSLYLGCAEELMSRISHRLAFLDHPLSRNSLCNSSMYTSLDQLVGEISNGIDELADYSKADDEATNSKDGLYIRLETDLQCNYILSAMWDMEWDNRICIEEAEQVVGQVQDFILFGLVEEVAVDLLY